MIETQELIKDHVEYLEKLAIEGDEDAVKTLACMALIKEENDGNELS